MPSEPDQQLRERIEQLFHDALEVEASERAMFLSRACEGNVRLEHSVQQLLEASAAAERRHAWELAAIRHEAWSAAQTTGGADLDRYRLLERIGIGGMGLVYKATRADDEFSKVVAIKILQGMGGDEELIRRFRQERQILAGLEHPHISRLLDGGSTPDGLPFLVMEYVDGIPIDRYVATTKLPVRELLSLFREICSAVSYAHQNLVVHRDLKPGNILVTATGVPKLLDFGIAKLLDGSAEHTRTGVAALTPEYASPEQVRNGSITTASDIYSLGVLLYRLLTGESPYGKTNSPMELAHAVCSDVPLLGGVAGRRLDPDLETIIQMALRKEPERRYASAQQFAEDLKRFEEGYPVLARHATRSYRLSRFLGRNKTPAVAAGVVLLALLSGIAATAWEASIANRRFNDVRKLANSYLFEFHDAIRDLPGSTPARRLVAKRALEYLDSLSQERGLNRALGAELATAYEKVGSVQGSPNLPSLGDRAGALVSYRKALSIRERGAASDPANAALAVDLARNYILVGDLLQRTGDLKGTAEVVSKAVRLMEERRAATPANTPVRDMLATAYLHLADVTGNNDVPNLGDAKGALALFLKSLVIRKQLVAADAGNREMRMWLGSVYGRIGMVKQGLNDNPGAAEAFREAIAINEQLVREEPLSVVNRREVAVNNRSLSLLFIRMQSLHEARACGDRSAEIFGDLAKADPDNVEAQEALADSIYSQGYVLEKSKDAVGALQHYESAVAIYNGVVAKHPDSPSGGLRTALQLIASLATEMGDLDKGLRSAQKELDIDRVLLNVNANNAGARRNQGVSYMQIGKVHELLAARAASVNRSMAQWHEARGWYQRSSDLWRDLEKNGTLIPAYGKKPAEAASGLARCDRALAASRHL